MARSWIAKRMCWSSGIPAAGRHICCRRSDRN
jgi:hypothetical protein